MSETRVVRFEPVHSHKPERLQRACYSCQKPFFEWAERHAITIEKTFWITNAVIVTTDMSDEHLVTAPGVESVHENFEGGPLMGAADYETEPGISEVQADAFWTQTGSQGAGGRVAILDTGINPDHPDIDLYTDDESDPTYPGGWTEFDDTGSEVDSEPYEALDHGTHVSGIATGGNNDGEYIGMAPEADLLHAKVSTATTPYAALVAGIEWAVDRNADAINISLGMPDDTRDAFVEPIRNAVAAGTVVVCAVGNNGQGDVDEPANVYEAFAVGSHDFDDSGGGFVQKDIFEDPPSEWPTEWSEPSVAAPGSFVNSASGSSGYDSKSGTSMASPHVAGAVALLRSIDQTLTRSDLEHILTESAFHLDGEDAYDTEWGHGKLQIADAIDEISDGIEGTVTVNGDAVEGATVYAVDTAAMEIVATQTTGSDGGYLFDDLAVGTEVHVLVQYRDADVGWAGESLPNLES